MISKQERKCVFDIIIWKCESNLLKDHVHV